MDTTTLGLFSSDGYFQSFDNLTVARLKYISNSREELEVLLQENLQLELYEECVLIRDELNKRN